MHYGLSFVDQSGRKWHNKSESGQKEKGGKLSCSGQKQRKWGTKSESEQNKKAAGVVALVWMDLSAREDTCCCWAPRCVHDLSEFVSLKCLKRQIGADAVHTKRDDAHR